jgi:hypothetical protein
MNAFVLSSTDSDNRTNGFEQLQDMQGGLRKT